VSTVTSALRPLLPCGSALKPCFLIVLAFDLVRPVLRQNSARLHAWGSNPSPASAAISSKALSIISCRSSRLSFTSIVLLTPAHWQHQVRGREGARWLFFVDWDWLKCSDYLWLKSPGANTIAQSLDADVDELLSRDLSAIRMPYLWLDATYVKCRRDGRVASTAVVTAIGSDEEGWRRVLGISVVDTESYDSWKGFLATIRKRGVHGAELVVSDAHEGLKRAIAEEFQGAAWQRCVVHLTRDCVREAKTWQLKRRVAKIVAPVFRAKDAGVVRCAYHLACEMLEECCPKAAAIMEEAEVDALAYLDFPCSHWKRLRTNRSIRSAPTARSSAAQGSCRYSRQFALWSAWQGP
jgi:hypothetical protein